MKIAERVIPNENNNEENLNHGSKDWAPLPAIRLGNGVWVARYTLNDEEKQAVAASGNIYIEMIAVDGDKAITPLKLFVKQPNIEKYKDEVAKWENPILENKEKAAE